MKYHIIYEVIDSDMVPYSHTKLTFKNSEELLKFIRESYFDIRIKYIILGIEQDLLLTYSLEEVKT